MAVQRLQCNIQGNESTVCIVDTLKIFIKTANILQTLTAINNGY